MQNHRKALPLFLTPEQAAEVLNIPVRTIYEKIRQGKLPISPHGKPYRVDRDGLFRMAREKGKGEDTYFKGDAGRMAKGE